MAITNNLNNIINKTSTIFQTQFQLQTIKRLNADILRNVSIYLHLNYNFQTNFFNFIGGSCKYGDKCSYAHGDTDLRVSQQNPTGGKPMGGQMRNNQVPQPNPMMDMQQMNQFPGMMM